MLDVKWKDIVVGHFEQDQFLPILEHISINDICARLSDLDVEIAVSASDKEIFDVAYGLVFELEKPQIDAIVQHVPIEKIRNFEIFEFIRTHLGGEFDEFMEFNGTLDAIEHWVRCTIVTKSFQILLRYMKNS